MTGSPATRTSNYHFHRGPDYARDFLGYDPAELAALPPISVDRFAGVGNPFAAGDIHPGETILDHACGAGTDLLIAARRAGPEGRAIGVDVTPMMREYAQLGAQLAGLADRVEIRDGRYEVLQVPDASIDVVISGRSGKPGAGRNTGVPGDTPVLDRADACISQTWWSHAS